ncbi:MAG TPA: DUF1800 domain-containing protein [Pyrinomonadaceae bacterium]|jgi:uncharacterized protein (DUF1800 family)|nr:DUF1800 domain-containing protein [Pyrinomonadaceae bacterium]
MTTSGPLYSLKHLAASTSFALLLIICASIAVGAASPKPPKLISSGTSTRAVAFESPTFKGEPFPLTATVPFSADTRTRICIFAMDLELLSGEGKNAFTADVQDSAGKLYALRIEFMGQVPGFPGITMFIVRLADEIGDVGDVLLRLNLHGMGSNRVRMGVGHVGGGPADDPGAVATPAPVTPPPVDAPLVPDSYNGPATDGDAVRFLEQATWGPTTADVVHVKSVGLQAYLNEQFSAPVTNVAKGSNYPDLMFPAEDGTACPTSSPGDPNYNQTVCNRDNFSIYPLQRTFYSNALYGPDQLRQRVAFALHQILVISGASEVNRPSWLTIYLQTLDRHAFGNYRTLLQEMTLTPSMGSYLDMNLSTRTNPNENFGREVLQLFSIGTAVLNSDGTAQLDSQGMPLASYSQTEVNEFTRVFTGWNFVPGTIAPGTANWRDPMVPRGGTNHDFNSKTLLNGAVTPACSSASGAANIACAQADLTLAIDSLFNHSNVGPFLGKQLIQHLVTSNPSGAYVVRVAAVFNNDCAGLHPINPCSNARGNLKAVVQAILLDPEARGDVKTDPSFGKLREPAQYINGFLRAFNVKSFDKLSTSDGVLGNRSTTDFAGTLDQPIFQPPTVFSYYQPGFEVPGTKILGPAFGILSTSTTLRRANDINTLVYTGVSSNTSPTAGSPDRPRGTSIDITNLEALAANPGDIADALNPLVFHGTMSSQVRTSLITAMNAINDANVTTRNQKRARVAVYLAATSSQYDIQR